ncbi:MAG: L,D-transpeptidase family protein [Pirellulaceae bacterium]
MQTIKTSSIVVLLMTVMYGGYVSLNTPLEPVPPEVADLLQFEDGLGIEMGIASNGESFGAGTSEANIATAPGSSLSFPNSQPQGNAPNTQSTTPSMSLGNPNGNNSSSIPQQSFQASNNIAAPTHGASFQGLPAVGTPARTVSADMSQSFPATDSSFQLPAPQNAQGSFNPQTGNSFNAPQNAVPANSSGNISLPAVDDLPDMDQPQTNLTEQVSLNVGATAGQNNIALANQPTAGQGSSATENIGLTNAFNTADRQYANDQLREALATLSVFYGTPNLPAAQRGALLTRLDPLAREVIYSPRHLLEKPHRVGSNETLMEISEQYQVPWQLLANINGIKDPLVITPGTELKVVKGPFTAQVDLAKRELTVFLDDLYAGRFPIAVGSDPAPQPGTFSVQDKQSQRTFYDRSGSQIAAGDPANPYGNAWIDLGSQLCIHGSPDPVNPTTKGCISLAANFADDLFGILSQGSPVIIRR